MLCIVFIIPGPLVGPQVRRIRRPSSTSRLFAVEISKVSVSPSSRSPGSPSAISPQSPLGSAKASVQAQLVQRQIPLDFPNPNGERRRRLTSNHPNISFIDLIFACVSPVGRPSASHGPGRISRSLASILDVACARSKWNFHSMCAARVLQSSVLYNVA